MNKTIKQFFFCAFFLGGFLAWQEVQAACATPCTKSGAIWTCTDISRECVQDASDASVDGDTIRLSAGSATWETGVACSGVGGTASMCFHKLVNLQGGIGGTTKITVTGISGYGAVLFYPDSASRNIEGTIEVSGITFDSNNTYIAEGILNATNYYTANTKVNIHNNVFQNSGATAARSISISGPVVGVIHNNTFDRAGGAVRAESGGYYAWTVFGPPVYGNENAIYVEDNTFLCSGEGDCVLDTATTGQGHPGVVFRYNTLDLTNNTNGLMSDQHGLQSMSVDDAGTSCGYDGQPACDPLRATCQQVSQLRFEMYGNIFTNYAGTGQTILADNRGGKSLFFNNRISGLYNQRLSYQEYACDSCLDPAGSEIACTMQNAGDTITKTNHDLTDGTAIVFHSFRINGIAAGSAGSKTTLTDTNVNFVTAGVIAGAYGDTVYNITTGESRRITSISTTVNANDTLNFAATSNTNDNGDSYYVNATYGGVSHNGLTPTAVYYVINSTDDTFQVATTVGGPAVPITADGDAAYFKFYSMHLQDSYFWNNWSNGTDLPMDKDGDHCEGAIGSPYAIAKNVDYFMFNANTLNGSTERGINCGSAVPTSACSVGDGYWQTTAYPCSTPPATMADMKTHTQTGKLYKCTAANTWTLYYQPYTYPHPLRGEVDTTALAAPTNFVVE